MFHTIVQMQCIVFSWYFVTRQTFSSIIAKKMVCVPVHICRLSALLRSGEWYDCLWVHLVQLTAASLCIGFLYAHWKKIFATSWYNHVVISCWFPCKKWTILLNFMMSVINVLLLIYLDRTWLLTDWHCMTVEESFITMHIFCFRDASWLIESLLIFLDPLWLNIPLIHFNKIIQRTFWR